MRDGAAIYREAFLEGLRPEPALTVSEWAEAHRELSQEAAAEPGKYRCARTPAMREIMDRLSVSDPVQVVCVMKSTQVGATECGNNWIGYQIDHAPAPALMVQPTVELAKRASKQRIQPMIEATPRLRRKVASPRSRDSGNTVMSKEYPGGILIMAGANSAAGLRSMPARYLFLDEVDGYEHDIDGEGDPLIVADKRTISFRNKRKVFIVSTPTIAGHSRIESVYERSDKRRYFVPCPECKTLQVLEWENVRWDTDVPQRLQHTTAFMVCIHCGARIDEARKQWMMDLARAEWQATADGDGVVTGYHISALYSPVGWRAWSDIVYDYFRARDDGDTLKAWTNTDLGLPYQESGEVPELEQIEDLKGPWDAGVMPGEELLLLTCGVDVQKDRLYFEVRGWAAGFESWQIDHGEVFGDVHSPVGWDFLSAMLDTGYDGQPIVTMLVDSGYARDEVYEFVRTAPQGRVFPSKGMKKLPGERVADRRIQDVALNGKKYGLPLWLINTHWVKGWLHARIERGGERPGAWHLNNDTTEDYCTQLRAEQYIPQEDRWKAISKANHYLDCAGLNIAAAHITPAIASLRHPQADAARVSGEATKSISRRLNQ